MSPAAIIDSPSFSGCTSIRRAAGMAQPKAVAIVGDDQVEGAIGCRVEMRERLGGGDRVGMVERFEHQLAARAPAGRRARASPAG